MLIQHSQFHFYDGDERDICISQTVGPQTSFIWVPDEYLLIYPRYLHWDVLQVAQIRMSIAKLCIADVLS